MKSFTMLIMVLAGCMLSAVSIQSIRAEDYSGVACRLVFDLDQDADFTMNQRGQDFYLAIRNFDGKIPPYDLSDTFLERIETTADGLRISSPVQLRYLTMKLHDSRALVIDFLKDTRQKKEGLIIAGFLADKGRLASADKEYHRLAIDYPEHYDILYAWGKLLIRRGSSRAAQKLALIPVSSSYYAAAQTLLSITDSSSQAEDSPEHIQEQRGQKSAPKPEEPEPQAGIETYPGFTISTTPDSLVITFPPEEVYLEKPNLLTLLKGLASKYILLAITLLLAILLIAALLIFGRFKKPARKPRQDIEESSLGLDTDTLGKMVNHLLADGWTNKEIARELKISLHEVKLIVRRLHFIGMNDDNVKE